MNIRDENKLEFDAWFKENFPEFDERMREMAWRAYQEGNARGFNDGMSAMAQMEGDR